MCGIAGSTLAGGARATEAMLGRLVHRGPDDHGLYVDEPAGVTLGARRLEVIDPGGGHQPMSNEDGGIWAIHNGELYDAEPARERLRRRGHRFRSQCDTELLVHLYEEHGAELVHAIDGMFAFAIWDAPRGRLVLGRDRFGEKPLFVRRAAGGLSFASELGALLAGLDANERPPLDPDAVDAMLVLGYIPPERAIVSGVEQLAPGSVLEWERGRAATVRSYWAPPEPVPEPDRRASTELTAETGRLLRRAVAGRLVADVPVGVFLSGGLDSTLVAALAREHGEVRSFTVGYGDGERDERRGAAGVARLLGTTHEHVQIEHGDVERLTLDVLGAIDQPLADQALIPMAALCARARESVTVALGGEGADEHFAGYPRYRWLQRAERAAGTPIPGSLTRAAARSRRPWARRLGLLAQSGSLADRNLQWVSAGRASRRASWYGERLGGVGSQSWWPADTTGGDAARNAIQLDQRLWLPGDVLVKADRASMRSSLELRAPFLARELVEFAAGVGFAAHVRGGGKALLRAVLEELVPAYRAPAKRGFTVPAGSWLRGPLRASLEHCVSSGRVVRDGWLRGAPLRELAQRHLSGSGDHADELWPVLALNTWLEGPVARDLH